MSFEFSKVSLKQISSKIGDGIHGTPIYDENGSYYFINGNNLGSGRIVITSSTKKVGRNEYLKHKKELNESTVLLSINGTIGNVALYDDEPVILGKSACYINILPDVSVRYIGYVLKDRPFQHYIKQQANGSTIKNVSLKLIRDYEFTLPPKVVQDRIAEILSSLDKKISVNENMNIILEQMAQALFKSWFVDFEPVKAKMTVLEAGGSQEDATLAAMTAISGKDADALAIFERENPEQYAELKATAELFPSAMQESELGEIPEGWVLSEIGAQIDIAGGATPPTKTPEFWNNGDIHWTTPKDLSNVEEKILLHTERKITKAGLDKISSGLLPVNTVLMSSRAPVGYLAIAKVPVAINQGYIAMKCNKELSPEFVLQWCSANMPEIVSRASGTTFAEISKKNFNPIPLVMPPVELVKSYTKQASAVYSLIENNMRENNSLTQLRDTLLPKLLSGEITLPEAEQAVSEAENV